MSSFNQLQLLTAERCGLLLSDGAVGAADTGALAKLVKAAIRTIEVAKPGGWGWLRFTGTTALVAATEAYTFTALAASLAAPAGTTIRKIHEVTLTSPTSGSAGRFAMKRVSRFEADTMYPYISSMVPQVWWAEGQNLGFRPVPDQAYSVRVTVILGERELAIANDVPLMPIAYQDAIVEKASELWFRRMHNLADAQAANGAYVQWIRDMKAAEREYTGSGRVRVESDDWG